MVTPMFKGDVVNGRMRLEDKNGMIEWLSSLEGKKIQVTIEKLKRKRTSGKSHEKGNQNGYYWQTIIPIVADYSGEHPNDMHEILLSLYAPRVPKEVLGQTHLTMIRSSKMTTIQFSEYCDVIIQKMAEFGIVIPPPKK